MPIEENYLNLSDSKLISQCIVQTFRSGGKGGQNVNKVETGVRLKHKPTGIITQSTKERSQYLNKQICLAKLRKKLEQRNIIPEERIPTKVPYGVIAEIKKEKKRNSEIKTSRKKIKIQKLDFD